MADAVRETLLKVHRERNGCLFTLTVAIEPDRGDQAVTFTEFYDYGPLGDDPGREYGYSVHAPYAALPLLADAYAPTSSGSPEHRLISAFRLLIEQGQLGDGQPLQANQQSVLTWFQQAGVAATTSTWSWINSD
ncbi:hypothetical protein AB0P21_23275 [Kribbella sp. NPDC056861]|uniref:hypothetical protein n=1 Tax=Kribbella sp. NPDC056861 TaxID=3154857 RepID=UPI00342CB068